MMGDHARYAGRLDGASALHQLELVERGEEEDKKTSRNLCHQIPRLIYYMVPYLRCPLMDHPISAHATDLCHLGCTWAEIA